MTNENKLKKEQQTFTVDHGEIYLQNCKGDSNGTITSYFELEIKQKVQEE